MQWSPLGTFMTTLHRQGVAIWGGPKWERVNRFAHQGVCLLEYSPNERFIITYSSQVRRGGGAGAGAAAGSCWACGGEPCGGCQGVSSGVL